MGNDLSVVVTGRAASVWQDCGEDSQHRSRYSSEQKAAHKIRQGAESRKQSSHFVRENREGRRKVSSRLGKGIKLEWHLGYRANLCQACQKRFP